MPGWISLTHLGLMVALGLACEVVFTALADYPRTKDRRLPGYTYLWMVPIYAVVYPALLWLYPLVQAWPWAARGALYVGIIYAVEYSTGWALRLAVGECPWERQYRGRKWAVHGLIRLDYAPAWLIAALLYEWVFRVLRGLA